MNDQLILQVRALLPDWQANKNAIIVKLEEVRSEISGILGAIRETSHAAEVEQCFGDLDQYQTLLAEAAFKYNVPLPDDLRTIVHDFDRLDDADARRYWLEKIRSGKYASFC